MKLQIVLLNLGFVCLSAANDNAPPLALSDIKSVNVTPQDVDACKKNYPDGCCFTGATKFTTQYEGTTIQSFTVTGNVAGNSCQSTSTLTFIPADASVTATNVAQGFIVQDKAKTLNPYNFLPYTLTLEINKKLTNTYYFSIAIQTKKVGATNYQTLIFSSNSSSSSLSILKISLIGLLLAFFTLVF